MTRVAEALAWYWTSLACAYCGRRFSWNGPGLKITYSETALTPYRESYYCATCASALLS